jgi:hypothetical protein
MCDSCQLGKSKKQPFTSSTRQTSCPLHLIHTDVWTSPITSNSGFKYYVIFIDDHSRYTWLYPLHTKSEVYECFIKFKLLVEKQFSSSIKQLQSDGGGEYTSLHFQAFLTKHGILHRKSCPYTSQQNGLAERKLRHILETGLTLLAHSHLSNSYWVDAFLTATHLINRLPTPTLNNVSPYFQLYHKEPEYHKLKVFGCKCYPLMRPLGLHKLEYRSKPCIFLGYSFAGYKCLDPITNKVYLSRHVVFDEQTFPAKDPTFSHLPSKINAVGDSSFTLPVSFLPPPYPFSTNSGSNNSHVVPNSTSISQSSVSASSSPPTPSLPSPQLSPNLPSIAATSNHSPATAPLTIEPMSSPPSPTPPANPIHPMLTRSQTRTISTTTNSNPPPPPTTLHPMVTRSQTGSIKPKHFPNFQAHHTPKYPLQMLHITLSPSAPSCYRKAASDPKWVQAMTEEFEALLNNRTWTLCPRPPHHNIISNKWVYRIKHKSDGTIERFKARLVAKGFEQQNGIDYTETFSSVIKPATIRGILSLAVQFNWSIRQLDISNAFLHGHLLEDVFMEQPRGFIDSTHPDYVCKLHKALYGLKQAPRAWFNRLSSFLLHIGFTASLLDSSLFTLHSGSTHIFMLVYVDDIILTGTDDKLLHSIIAQLQQEFPLKDLGSLHFFLGIHVTRTDQGLHLCQAKYIADLLHRTHMQDVKPSKSPSSSGLKLSKYDGDPLPHPTEYRQVVGALQYCTLTRPEISFSVNQLCQHMHAPSTTHWTAVKQVLRYLKDSVNHGLLYTKGSLNLSAYCDSDWAGCLDDRRSTTGFAVFLGPNLISWCAKKQSVVSRSSTEAEYRALAITTAEVYWLRMLFCEIQFALIRAPTIWCDNVSALALASNPVYHARTKHIEIDYYFVREKVLNQDIHLQFISSNDQIADIFTKGLSSLRFLLLRSKLMVVSSPISLRGADREPVSTETQARDYSNQTPTPAHDCSNQTPAHSIHSKDHRTRQLNAHHAKISSCNPFLSRLCAQTR